MVAAMRSVWLVALANLRRRRGQSWLVGAIIGLSALLTYTGLGTLLGIKLPVEAMFEARRASHLVMLFDSRIHDPETVRRWWSARPEVAGVTEALPLIELRERGFYRGRELSSLLAIAERPRQPSTQDSLEIIEGGPASGPKPGEIWLPTALALGAGIHAGDTLEIPTAMGLTPFPVGAVVVDPQFSTPFTNPTRLWIAPGELATYFQGPKLSRVLVGVRLRDLTQSDRLWAEFVQAQGGAYGGAMFDYQFFLGGYTAPYTVFATMIVAFSVLGFLVALFALQGTITSAILADFKTIGVLRAQGFRPVDVGRIYQIQYLAIAGMALPIGAGIGVLVVRAATQFLTRAIHTAVPIAPLLLLGLAVLAFFFALVYLFILVVTRQAASIRPADAIRFGSAASAKIPSTGIPLARLRRFSVPLMVAVKNLVLQKGRAVFLAIAVLFATLAGFLGVNLDKSMGRMRTDLVRFGFDDAQVRVSRSGKRFSLRHDALLAMLRHRDGVRAVATWDGIDGTIIHATTGRSEVLLGTVVDGDMDEMKYANIRGRNPVGGHEVTLAVGSAKELAKDVGDSLELSILGTRLRLAVVGVYQSINNTGHGFRVRLEGVRVANPLWSPTEYGVALHPGVDGAKFIADLEAEYGEAVDASPGDLLVRDQLESIIQGLRLSNGFLALVFLVAAAVFIFNTTLLTIAENRRIFGIFKATGMTPAQLRLTVVAGIGVQAAFGIAGALLAWWLVAPAFVSMITSAVGMVNFPLENSVAGMAVIVPLVLLFSLASAWIPARRVLDVNPRHLIVE